MKLISTKAHGVLDYLVGILLVAAPWLFDFNRGGAETWVPVALGLGAIAYSLVTNYEMGVWKAITMRTHLNLDLISGGILAASPWVFDFNEFVYLPHLILGVLEMGAALLTDTVPGYAEKRSSTADNRTHRHAR